MNSHPTEVSALCPVIQYTRASKHHSPKSWCVSRRERTKIIKNRKVFSTCTLMNTKLFQNQEAKVHNSIGKIFPFFFLITDSLCNQEQPKLLVKVPNKTLESSCHFKLKRKQCSFGVSGNWASFHAAQVHHFSFHEPTLSKCS